MKFLVAIASLVFASSQARAIDFNKTARSGVQSFMHNYYAYDGRSCEGAMGSVVVLRKPGSGRVSSHAVRSVIGTGRHSVQHCVGKSINALQVRYRSAAGFRGTDSFQVQVTHPKHDPQIDTFTITVQ